MQNRKKKRGKNVAFQPPLVQTAENGRKIFEMDAMF